MKGALEEVSLQYGINKENGINKNVTVFRSPLRGSEIGACLKDRFPGTKE